MIYKYNKKNNSFNKLAEVDFISQNILERKHIESWVEEHPDITGEPLLIITKEYDRFDKTKERLDLLALDKNGKVVILELKRDDSGKDVDLQALKYAAYCSTLTMSDIVDMRRKYIQDKSKKSDTDNVEQDILDFIENDDFEKIDDDPRIILISKEFRPEVGASIDWLRKHNVDISCIKITPYKISEEEIDIEAHKIYPPPEIEDFLMQVARKEAGEKGLTRTQKEYIEFWAFIKDEFERRTGVQLGGPPPRHYYQIATGINGVHFEWSFEGRPRRFFNVDLHFEKSSKQENVKLINFIKQSVPTLEKKLKETVQIDPNWTKRWGAIYVQKNEGAMTESLRKYAVDTMEIMYKILKPKLDDIIRKGIN